MTSVARAPTAGLTAAPRAEPVGLTSCDREPIHVPGSIQPHGVLIAIRESDAVVTWVSVNAATHLGADARAMLGKPLADALGEDLAQRLSTALADPRAAGIEPLPGRTAAGLTYEATWHRTGALVIVEVELRAEADLSTMTTLFADVRQATDSLHAASTVKELCATAARAVRDLTGYDRVMVYQFHPDEHGEVVGEARDDSLEPFLGLHYPASDIPVQARRLYLLNRLRLLVDVDYEPVPLLTDLDPAAGPLDLSHAALRSMSPMHLLYLRNMGVQATLTISLMEGSRLWGLVVCHHRSPKAVGPQIQAACRLLSQMFSLQVVAAEKLERNAYGVELASIGELLVARMSSTEYLTTALEENASSALRLTDADGMVARINGRTVSVGVVPHQQSVDQLVALLQRLEDDGPFVFDDLPHRADLPSADPASASGVLALPLTPGWDDFVLWFRGEVVHTVTWGGEPDKSTDPDADLDDLARISPRRSFAAWSEQVHGRSRPWLRAEVDAATALATSVPELLLARARNHLAHLALHDSLTGLPNRSHLIDRIDQALQRPRRDGRGPALLFVDMDRFKLVNDALGHAAGDALLRQVAARITAETRSDDTVARLGGDEFVVLCDDTSPADAQHLADRLVTSFQSAFRIEGRDVTSTVSVGLAMAEPNTTAAALLKGADAAMYRAKHGGRNATVLFTPDMHHTSVRRFEIESALRPALERGDLRLHFQPVRTVDGALAGFEALARWALPGGGIVPPSEFIPVAQSSGLMGALTAWALDEGLRKLALWRSTHPIDDLTLSVNVAAGHVTGEHLLETVTGLLRRHRLPPDALCLEITDGELLADDLASRRLLDQLRELGVALSIDFGSGFSSLSYLGRLPVQEVKINRALIAGLPGSRIDSVVVASLVSIARELGMHTVADGVETEEQLAAVRRLGCDRVQGYLLGRPMPTDEIDRFLAGETALPPAAP